MRKAESERIKLRTPKLGFELAKLAKESGFINGTDNYIMSYNKVYKDTRHDGAFDMKKGDIKEGYDYIVNNGPGDYSGKLYNMYENPSLLVLREWLEQTKKIYVFVLPILNAKGIVYMSQIVSLKGNKTTNLFVEDEELKDLKKSGLSFHKIFDEYNEAFRAGLVEGLKLIK